MAHDRRSIVRPALSLALAAGLALAPALSAGDPVPDWPEVFDPFTLLTLNLTMDPADWDTVRFDTTYDIEVPAMFWAEGETPIEISVRRKSASALPSEADPQKVSLKLDINEYVSGQTWHGLKKLSLENGDDANVVTEGFAWRVHRVAAWIPELHYEPGYATWVQLNVNGSPVGVYVNVEQRDKTFLQNRGLFTDGLTWFYEIDDIGSQALEVGDPHSPTFEALCYSPFEADSCLAPDEATIAADAQLYLDLGTMFSLGASNAFVVGPDALFSKGKNFFYVDRAAPPALGGEAPPIPRLYVPWDLDSTFQGLSTTKSIYDRASGQGNDYQDLLLDNTTLRPIFDDVFCNLLAGPFGERGLVADLDAIEASISAALAADPNNQIGADPSGQFDALRAWVPARIANVRGQLPPCSAIFRDGFERGDTVYWSATTP